MAINSFAGCSSLGYHMYTLRVCRISVLALLAFRVSTAHWEVRYNSNFNRSAFICNFVFSFATFTIRSLFCTFNILIIIYEGEFLFWSWLFNILYASCAVIETPFFLDREDFSYGFVKKISSVPMTLVSSPFSSLLFADFIVSQISCMYCV